MRLTLRNGVSALLLLAAIVRPAAAQHLSKRVTVSLLTGGVGGTVPFGERFTVIGKAPARIERATLLFSANCADTTRQDSVDTWIPDPRVGSDSFALRVPAVSANTYFCLWFRLHIKPDSGQQVRMQQRVADSVRTAFERASQAWPTGTATLLSFQRSLIRAVQSAVGDSVRFLPNSVFDTTWSSPPRLRQQTDSVLSMGGDTAAFLMMSLTGVTRQRATSLADALREAGIEEALRKRRRHLDSYRMASSSAEASLRRVFADPGVTVVPSLVRGNPALATLLCQAAPDIALLDLFRIGTSADQYLAFVAAGRLTLAATMTPAQVAVAVPDSLSPAQIAARRARLDSTTAQLVRLRTLVAQFSGASLVETALADVGEAVLQLRQVRDADNLLDVAIGTITAGPFVVPVTISNIGGLQARAKGYISADFGLAYSAPLGQMLAYAGANFYLRSVNRDVPLTGLFGRTRDRLSFNVGVVFTKVARAGEREGLLGDASVLAGAGYRTLDWLRVGAGAVLFRSNDPANPAGTDRVITGAWYLSLSLDQDLKDLVGGLLSLFK